jgi:hypothetical protein
MGDHFMVRKLIEFGEHGDVIEDQHPSQLVRLKHGDFLKAGMVMAENVSDSDTEGATPAEIRAVTKPQVKLLFANGFCLVHGDYDPFLLAHFSTFQSFSADTPDLKPERGYKVQGAGCKGKMHKTLS